MTGITRAAFAATMGVHPSQATRWVQQGMPTLADGSVEPAEAAAWVRRNVSDDLRRTRSLGAAQVHAGHVQRQDEKFEEAIRLGLWLFAQQVPGEVARLAIQAGAAPAVAYSLYRVLQRRAPQLADITRREWMGLNGDPPLDVSLDLDPPDWSAIAKAARVRFDEASWERAAAEAFPGELPQKARAATAESAAAD